MTATRRRTVTKLRGGVRAPAIRGTVSGASAAVPVRAQARERDVANDGRGTSRAAAMPTLTRKRALAEHDVTGHLRRCEFRDGRAVTALSEIIVPPAVGKGAAGQAARVRFAAYGCTKRASSGFWCQSEGIRCRAIPELAVGITAAAVRGALAADPARVKSARRERGKRQATADECRRAPRCVLR